jgi:DNA-binding CsgD family transcriptional regulator
MNYLKQILFFIVACLSFYSTVAQIPGKGYQDGTGKENPARLIRLAEWHRINENYKSGIAEAKQAASIALKLRDFTVATKAYVVLAVIYANQQQFSLLKRTVDSALLTAQQAHTPIAMAYAYYGQASFYKNIDNAELAVKYGQMGLKELKNTSDHYISAKINYLLYAINSNWDNVASVNRYARQATENALLSTDYNLLGNCYTALSVAADYNYNATKSTAQRDSILYFLKKVEEIYQQHPKEIAPKTYGIACINISSYYLKNFPETDKNARSSAIQYANIAQTVMKDAVNGEEIIASALGVLSEYAMREKKFPLAESYLLQAYTMMQTEEKPYYYTLVNVVRSLAQFYEQMENYPMALKFQKRLTEYNAKLFDQKRALNVQKLEIQYESEKKNNEVMLLRQKEKYNSTQKNLYIGIAAALLLGLIFMFRSYHFRLRYSLQREKQLHLEKHEAELQAKLGEEEQLRLKAEQQLLETQQQQLQKEMMANVLQLEHKKDMLSKIREKLNDNHELNINKIWNEELLLDTDFENTKLHIQQVHPDFFSILNEKAQQKLTPLDLKLCAYLYLKLDTKKIASILHIEPKSVRMSRYRIKQKLELDKEEDLNIFLQNLG